MKLKKLKIFGIVIAFALTFPLHFLYDKLPCFFTSIFAPVNESIWEHMKIIFGSILLSGVIQKIIVIKMKLGFKNVCISNFIAAITAIPIFLIIYLPIYYVFGENFIITIILLFIVIVISQIITYYIITRKKDIKLENFTFLLVILTYIVFTLLTYFPIKCDLFYDPVGLYYGIEKINR